jgi:transcriptional regulator with XRE-family HTH domain
MDYEKAVYSKLVDEIVKVRKSQGKTQDEIADLLGLGLTTYASMEQGRSKFTFERLLKVCKYLNIEIGDIINPPKSVSEEPITELVSIENVVDLAKAFSKLVTREEFQELAQDIKEIKELLKKQNKG